MNFGTKALFLLGTLALCLVPILRAQSNPISEFPLSSGTNGPIALGSDGNLWFTQGNTISRITTAGVVTEYQVPPPTIVFGITAGPDDALWFTDILGKIGRITTSGAITAEYPVSGQPDYIVTGPDGALWFTEISENNIGRITTSGTLTEYQVPTAIPLDGGLQPSSGPLQITAGPDGALWFTEVFANQIGRITTDGVFTEYPIPKALSNNLVGIASGPDGAVWFGETASIFGDAPGKVGRITTGGVLTEFPLPPASENFNGPTGIALGPDGALWFTEQATGKIARITANGDLTEFPLPDPFSQPLGITKGPDGAMWFTEGAAKIGRIAVAAKPIIPDTLFILTGDQQVGRIGKALPSPLTVRVTDQNGNPMAGISILFSVTQQPSGGTLATVTPNGTATAPDGTASSQLVLGSKTGQYQVNATCSGHSCTPNAVSFSERAGCRVPITPWLQCAGKDAQHSTLYAPFPAIAPDANGHWGAEPYAFYVPSEGITMCTYGCGTTSLAMALLAAKVRSIPGGTGGLALGTDPGHLNAFMNSDDNLLRYTPDNDVDWWVTTRDLGNTLGKKLQFSSPTFTSDPGLFVNSKMSKVGVAPRSSDPSQQPVYDYLDQALCSGVPIIVMVPGIHDPSKFPKIGHFVLVYGQQDDDYLIADPAGDPANVTQPRNQLLSGYGQFIIRGFVSDPDDLSALTFSVGENSDLLVTDETGRQTGFDLTAGQVLGDIPQSLRSVESEEDDEGDGPPTPQAHLVHIYQPSTGSYNVIVSGLQLGVFDLGIRAFALDGSSQPPLIIKGIAGPGSTASFQLNFTSAPGSVLNATPAATFTSALADISNSLQLGLIDDSGVANSLFEKLQNARNAQEPARTNLLNAFLNEVNAQAGKHITGVAIQVLIRDAKSLM